MEGVNLPKVGEREQRANEPVPPAPINGSEQVGIAISKLIEVVSRYSEPPHLSLPSNASTATSSKTPMTTSPQNP
jgi:hypothetical protein